MNNEYLKLLYSIRLVLDSGKLLDEFKMSCSEYDVRIGEYFDDKSKSVLSVRLFDGIDLTDLKKFIDKNKSRIENIDIFISMRTSYETRIIDIPKFVTDAICHTDGKVCFSYTFTE